MRVLFSCSASDGHFMPLVPLARAFAERGNEVAFATAAGFAGRVGGAADAIEVRPPAVSVESIRSSLAAVLDEPRYAAAAKRLAVEADAMLSPAEAAAILS